MQPIRRDSIRANRDECDLFHILRKPLFRDLVANGAPPSVAGTLLKWFDPAHDDYLQRIDAWQCLLCTGASDRTVLPPEVVHHYLGGYNVFGNVDVFKADPYDIRIVHTIAKLFYKFRGQPRKNVDMEDVKQRFRRPGHLLVTQREIRLLRQALTACLPPRSWEQLVGRFGPGVTADGMDAWGKWCRRGGYPRRVPITLFMHSIDDYVNLPPIRYSRYGITKVAEVPKSLKTNRVVSSEPANFMFAQLAVGEALSKELHRVFPGNVFLHDQRAHNRLLYCSDACSIDLSDASDHVSRTLVRQVLPDWWPYLASVRSSFAQFPDGEVVPLRTFAPMGSGVCFPVLTAVCLAICKVCCRRPFHVYGDDVIVFKEDYFKVINLMTWCGLVVNSRKSCYNTVYRESCGVELFHNVDITPTYIREDWRRTDAAKLELMFEEFSSDVTPFAHTRNAIWQDLEQVFRRVRWNSSLQRQEVEALCSIAPARHDLPSYAGLFRWFCTHAESHGVPLLRSNASRLGWRYKPARDYPDRKSVV